MQGPRRKLLQAVAHEGFALLLITPAIAWTFGSDLGHAGGLTLLLCSTAMLWNMAFNSLFEAWEASRRDPRRTLVRRVLHACGFELGLALLTVPMIAWWLAITWWQALLTDGALSLFFLGYTLVFQWVFDLAFGPPAATLGAGAATCTPPPCCGGPCR
ncbi:PACE efflux transporter [Pseudomonas sp. BN417]|uniref:PACE efflux transporter n=1 Tax=Pseudomonas sp. BN417 TaxID=2567890 RepID=UPI002456D454|nr:PACE efflux transporter [Pseudomonas sp. BN417]MDH4553963.1 PACE efflux transporter [Pseudomonas sp. BN417]